MTMHDNHHHNTHHLCDMEPLPPNSAHHNDQPPLLYPPQCCRGVWFYVCCQEMKSYILNHRHCSCEEPPYTPLPPPLQPIHHVSDDSSHLSFHTITTILITKKMSVKNLDNKPTVRVYCKAKTGYSLTIRDGKVILAPTNPSDPLQHWIKDEEYGVGVKDGEGMPSFTLVNKATGQAMKHSIGITYPVQLTKYNSDKLDETVLWSQGGDLGDGYRSFRAVNNFHLNLDAYRGLKEFFGVYDGTEIKLWEWANGNNQKWTIDFY